MRRVVLVLAGLLAAGSARAEDPRAWQHGIDIVRMPGGSSLLLWSSSGMVPTGPGTDGNWTHDVFVADPADPASARPLVSAPEAQEPVSAATSADGRLMVTFEDGWDTPSEVSQRFALYGPDLAPLAPYPQLVADGGHSGHVAAAGDRFVVVYSDGWIDGGGVDGLGTGRDVLVKVFSSGGRELHRLTVAKDRRDWWPLVAASPRRALLLWQRFQPGRPTARLMAAVLDPATGVLIRPPAAVAADVRLYTYAVAFVPATGRFVVTGTTGAGAGFAALVDEAGRIVARRGNLLPTVREAKLAVDGARVLQLTAPTGGMVFSVAGDQLTPVSVLADDHPWQGIGAVAELDKAGAAQVFSLSKGGLIVRRLPPGLPAQPVGRGLKETRR
ncbi:MAG: hypothetical protein NVV74_07415 [Magnetospirillum sp.]|nr:hypothetical protein [Magnetospirillum sp.]